MDGTKTIVMPETMSIERQMLMRTYASTFVHNPTGKPIQMELCMIVLNVLNVVLLADSDFFVLAHYE